MPWLAILKISVEGASIWMQYLTAWGGLVHLGQLNPQQHVLITAASSSVGLAAIELTKLAGAHPIAVTRTSAKKQALLDFGAAEVIASTEEDLPAKVRQYTKGAGADLIFDPMAGPSLEALAQSSARGAQIIKYGALSPDPTPFPLILALRNGLVVRGYVLWEMKVERSLAHPRRALRLRTARAGEIEAKDRSRVSASADRRSAPLYGVKPAKRQDRGQSAA